jgi:hypothetical protein
MKVIRHALHRVLKISSIVLAGIVENDIVWDVFVPALEFRSIILGRGSSCGCVVPSVARATATPSSVVVVVVVVPCPVSGGRARRIIFFLDVVPHVDLLGDVAHANGQYYNDDCEREPRVLGLDTSCDDDDGDGRVGRDSNEHCADRLSLYFEFHLMTEPVPR